jgi:hypothetical protein
MENATNERRRSVLLWMTPLMLADLFFRTNARGRPQMGGKIHGSAKRIWMKIIWGVHPTVMKVLINCSKLTQNGTSTSRNWNEHEKGRIPEKWNIKRPIYHSMSCLAMTAATRLVPTRLSRLIDIFEFSQLLLPADLQRHKAARYCLASSVPSVHDYVYIDYGQR